MPPSLTPNSVADPLIRENLCNSWLLNTTPMRFFSVLLLTILLQAWLIGLHAQAPLGPTSLTDTPGSIVFTPATDTCVPGQLILSLSEGTQADVLIRTLLPYGYRFAEKTGTNQQHEGRYLLAHFAPELDVRKAAGELYQTGLFEFVEPNLLYRGGIFPTDPMFPQQYGCHNTGVFHLTFATADSDADLPEAWDIEQGDTSVNVAVLDAGLALTHPEFTGRVWQNYAEVPANGFDDDLNGYIDDSQGWNFAYNNNNPADDYGHGTASAGIIAANPGNSTNIAGIDWNCKLMVCKVLDSTNFASITDIVDAIFYAADNGADVINMSFAGGYSSLQEAAIQYAWDRNCVMVAATGNSNSSVPLYPSADSLVLSVGGSNAWDVRYIYSNYGVHMDLVAAGDWVYIVDYANAANDSAYASGTSLAAPFVSGVASLLKGQDTSRTNQEIYDILRYTAEDTVDKYTGEDTPGWDQYFGYGRVNARRALVYDSLLAASGPSHHPVDEQICLWPNPNTGIFSVLFPAVTGEITITVADVTGKTCHTQVAANTRSVQLHTDLPAGVYFVTVKTPGQHTVLRMLRH